MPFTKDELERIADQANRWSIEKHGVPYLEHADQVAAFLGVPRQPEWTCVRCKRTCFGTPAGFQTGREARPGVRARLGDVCAECFDMADYSLDLEEAVASAKHRFPAHNDPAQYDGDIARYMQIRGWEPDGRFWRTSARDGRRTRPTATDTDPPEPRDD